MPCGAFCTLSGFLGIGKIPYIWGNIRANVVRKLHETRTKMIITFKSEVFRYQRRADGSYNVKIRVTYKRQSRRLPTTLTAWEGRDVTKAGKLKPNTEVSRKAGDLIARMQGAVAELSPFAAQDMGVDDVVAFVRSALTEERFTLDFFAFADSYLTASKLAEHTRNSYATALARFSDFLGERRLDINDLTARMLREWLDLLAEDDIVSSTARTYIARLSKIYNAARDKYNDEDEGKMPIPRNPFARVKVTWTPSKGARILETEEMQAIIHYTTEDPRERFAVDVFVVSFGLMGANMADLWEAVPPRSGVWDYGRKKTRGRRADGAEMKVRIPSELEPFLARLIEGAQDGRWLNLSRRYPVSADPCSFACNKALKGVAKALSIAPFSMYTARKTFATEARRRGVEKATIDECLCHIGDLPLADIYIARNWQMLWDAQRVVVEAFEW